MPASCASPRRRPRRPGFRSSPPWAAAQPSPPTIGAVSIVVSGSSCRSARTLRPRPPIARRRGPASDNPRRSSVGRASTPPTASSLEAWRTDCPRSSLPIAPLRRCSLRRNGNFIITVWKFFYSTTYREIHTPSAGESRALERQGLDCEEAPSSSWTCEGPIHDPRGCCSALRCYLRLHRLRRHCVSIGLRSSLHSVENRSIKKNVT